MKEVNLRTSTLLGTRLANALLCHVSFDGVAFRRSHGNSCFMSLARSRIRGAAALPATTALGRFAAVDEAVHPTGFADCTDCPFLNL